MCGPHGGGKTSLGLAPAGFRAGCGGRRVGSPLPGREATRAGQMALIGRAIRRDKVTIGIGRTCSLPADSDGYLALVAIPTMLPEVDPLPGPENTSAGDLRARDTKQDSTIPPEEAGQGVFEDLR
jgi:hypothetical protein